MKGLFKNRGNSVKDTGSPRQRRSLGTIFGKDSVRKRQSSSSLEKLSGSENGVSVCVDIEERVYQRGAIPVNLFTMMSLQQQNPDVTKSPTTSAAAVETTTVVISTATSVKRADPLSLKLPQRRDSDAELLQFVEPTPAPGEPGSASSPLPPPNNNDHNDDGKEEEEKKMNPVENATDDETSEAYDTQGLSLIFMNASDNICYI